MQGEGKLLLAAVVVDGEARNARTTDRRRGIKIGVLTIFFIVGMVANVYERSFHLLTPNQSPSD